MLKLFISYRRTDSEPVTQQIHRILESEFGEGKVFIDQDLGVGNWFTNVMNAVNSADACIVVIGKDWLNAINEKTKENRLFELGDVVRREVEQALTRPLTVIVLVNGATIPSEAQLPETIAHLPDMQAFVVRNDAHFEEDVKRVAKKIKAFFPTPAISAASAVPIAPIVPTEVTTRRVAAPPIPNLLPLALGVLAALVLILGVVFVLPSLSSNLTVTPTIAPTNLVVAQGAATVTPDVMQIVAETQAREAEQTRLALPTITGVPTEDLAATVNAINTGTRAYFQTQDAERFAQATADAAATSMALPTATRIPSTLTRNPVEVARSGVTANDQWTPVTQEFAGVTMVLVPVGCFEMGTSDAEIARLTANKPSFVDYFARESPQHQQCFDQPFWIGEMEVTQADFVQLGGAKANANYFNGSQRPVEQITWFEAREFCTGRGMRLPTEAEWEYAARGPDSLKYPWGDTWEAANAVAGRSSTSDVGRIAAGVSWVGAFDMSGNVWEWVSTIYGVDDGDYNFAESGETAYRYPYILGDYRELATSNSLYLRVVRGGSWEDDSSNVRAANRYGYVPVNESKGIGVRCARSN